jgi:2-polyprenyl-3-methyl-5-hydroxy-6-metoxy-1,4-benzoquinol methylase
MKQNKYDDPNFFERYSAMSRSVEGLSAAGEWYVLREMLPDLRDKRVLDLGCGFGWHYRYAREQQARHVVGVDLSENMLTRAQEMTNDAPIEYRQMAIEDMEFAPESFDVVLSSLAFHYNERIMEDWFGIMEICNVNGDTLSKTLTGFIADSFQMPISISQNFSFGKVTK